MDYDAQRIVDSINKFQAGSVEAFNDIYEGTYRLVYSTCYGIIKDEEDSRDVTQDAFVYMYEKLETLNNPSAYAKWMKLIASGRALNFVKRKGYTYNVEDDVEMDMALADWEQFDSIPESFIEDEEKKQIINKVLKESLSEVQYQTIFMYYFGEMPLASIAETMNCPEGTVKTRLMHAKARFRESLEGYLDDNKLVLAATPFMTRFFNANAPKVSIPSIAGLGIPGLVGTAGMAGAGAGSSSIGSGLSAAADAGQSAAANTAQVAGANIGQIAAGESSPAAAAEVGQKALGNMGTKSSAKSAQAVRQSPSAVNSPVSDPGVSAAGNTGKIVGARGGFLSTVAGKVVAGIAAVAVVATAVTVAVIVNKKDEPVETTVEVTSATTEQTTTAATEATETTAAPEDMGVKVGNTVTFGNYAGEDIEWLVLDENGDDVLILTKYAIDAKAYNSVHKEVTWETCSLRKWLNNSFYESAFSDEEKEMIRLTTVVNPDTLPKNKGGNDTEDNVFLLSVEEAYKYLGDSDMRVLTGTKHALNNRLYTSDDTCCWWLRSPGINNTYASTVSYDGSIGNSGEHGSSVSVYSTGVRPAMWVNKDGLTDTGENTDEHTDSVPFETVVFGNYAGEDIEWFVLDSNDNEMLLLSRYVIEQKSYHDTSEKITWEKCSLRKWLNKDFYGLAFSDEEKNRILKTTVINPDNDRFKVDGGKNTKDYVFLLSVDEANKYFDSDIDRIAYPTEHASANGVILYENVHNMPITGSRWWLRSPGLNSYSASVVIMNGYVASEGQGFGIADLNDDIGVRPAMWVKKDAVSITSEGTDLP